MAARHGKASRDSTVVVDAVAVFLAAWLAAAAGHARTPSMTLMFSDTIRQQDRACIVEILQALPDRIDGFLGGRRAFVDQNRDPDRLLPFCDIAQQLNLGHEGIRAQRDVGRWNGRQFS